MAIISALLLVLSAAVTSVVGDPVGSVTCSETGFEPTFVKTFAASTYWSIKIGTANNLACKSGEIGPIVAGDATLTISKTEFNGGAEITYKTCGGTLANASPTPTTIDFTVSAVVTVRVQGSKISRETYTSVLITCQLTKLVASPTSASSWLVDAASATVTTGTGATSSFTFAVEINYYADNLYAGKVSGSWTGPAMGSWLYIRVEETTTNPLFHFVVQSCWFTKVSASLNDAAADEFFTDGCMVDTTSTNNDQQSADKVKGDITYDMKVKAFFFTGEPTTAVYLHCQLYVCMEADTDSEAVKCAQISRSTCGMTRKRRSIEERKRRSAETIGEDFGKDIDFLENGHGPVETRTITAEKPLLLPNSEVIVPSCGADFIYDRVSKGCSNQNLLNIKGVYLDIPWNPEYADTTSKAWTDFKIAKEYQLWALVMMYDTGRQIRGLEVLSASKGSVILTLRIKYDETATASAAQAVFEHAYKSASETRVDRILNIRQDKVIEYVQVRPTSSGVNIENLTLIIIVVVLCAVVFVSVVAAWKVRSSRRGASSGDAKAHDNPTYNMS